MNKAISIETKIRIDINEVKALERRMREIDSYALAEIEWVDGETPLVIPPEVIEEWKFIGLTNCSFIEMEFYKGVDCAE